MYTFKAVCQTTGERRDVFVYIYSNINKVYRKKDRLAAPALIFVSCILFYPFIV